MLDQSLLKQEGELKEGGKDLEKRDRCTYFLYAEKENLSQEERL